jgi:hypothetical protein
MSTVDASRETGGVMMKLVGWSATAVALATGWASAALADETGFASSHTWRKERGLTCMSDHWHYGSSGVQPTKAKAEREAIISWSSFTAFEYGSNWARFGKAGSKKISCTKSPSGFDCSVEARPCR